VIIALQTSGINLEMDALNILNKYIKLPSELYINITAHLSLEGITRRKEVFFREINGDTIFSNTLKPVGVILIIFSKPLLSSMRNLLKTDLYAPCDFIYCKNVRTHYLGLLHLSLLFIAKEEALQSAFYESVPAGGCRLWCGMGGMYTGGCKQLRVTCSECTFTMYCACCGNVTLNSSEHMKTYRLLFVQWQWNKCFQDG
jgi:hypothetical protein